MLRGVERLELRRSGGALVDASGNNDGVAERRHLRVMLAGVVGAEALRAGDFV